VSAARAPTGLDRIEASHWIRDACGHLTAWLGCSERFDQFPVGFGTYEHWIADLDVAIERIETAKAALHGQHSRGGGTSLLRDIGPAETRQPDMRPSIQRRPERSGA
jgi:hypothetical protein